MKQGLKVAVAAFSFAALIATNTHAAGLKAEVLHWWTSGGQAAGVRVLADAYAKAGGEWVDNAIANPEQARSIGINRVVSGDPPTMMQMNAGKQFDELVDQGLLRNLDAIADAEGWRKVLPADVLDAVSRNGHIYAVPVGLQTPNWLWYNKAIFQKNGLTEPTTWDQFFADADKLKQAGVIPLAVGAQPPWINQLFNGVLVGAGGQDVYLKIMRDKDADAVKSPAFLNAAKTFSRLRDYIDPGSPNRSFNEAAAMIIRGTAAMHIMGDWEKGEFNVAGLTAGKDYGCVVGMGDQTFLTDSNVFVMPVTQNPDTEKAQDILAKMLLSKDVQIAFNNKKGNLPVRTDIDPSTLDACAQIGIKVLQDPKKQLPGPDWLATPDMLNSLEDVNVEFWASKTMTPEQFADKYAAVVAKFKE
jgi:glucose/mannose transport system substrate-binding protein